ncbi:hypothetical protein BpHYR1_019301 [Brachionus plicatilis]|uniref:Uncharacterized protein n=1 Tax=Brachionus plicatilis TaxID=10195 RepID=A0A3M7RH31_BRAPC|nr:hypothetical protein BpHYR1_019301 [Brachionus plicatilis]
MITCASLFDDDQTNFSIEMQAENFLVYNLSQSTLFGLRTRCISHLLVILIIKFLSVKRDNAYVDIKPFSRSPKPLQEFSLQSYINRFHYFAPFSIKKGNL